ncbi:MAG: hypothetical protein QOF60_837 [Actinomycetota bacterium]|jgi:hypothetical protein|nr:hypothetical protein [Actinomycetota bacterium]
MRFTIEQHFDAPLDAVEAAYTDLAFLEKLSTLPKLGRPTLLRREEDGDIVRQAVQYRFTGEVNAAVRKVVDPARLTWVEESSHDRATHTTTWHIVPDHYRQLLRASGTFLLEPDGGAGTRRITEAELKVSVPLLGGKVEHAIVSGLREHADAEAGAMRDFLTTGP